MKKQKTTAQGCAVQERRDAWGTGTREKEEKDRVEMVLLGRKKTEAQERRGRGRFSVLLKEMCRKQTRTEGKAGDSNCSERSSY